MQRIFHTPEGVRDIYGEECSRKKRLQKELHQVFSLSLIHISTIQVHFLLR